MGIYLVAIGCNYRQTESELPDCEMDAISIVDALSDHTTACRAVLGKGRRAIESTVRRYLGRARSGDIILLSFSGHGTTGYVGGKKVQGIVTEDMEVIYDFELRQIVNTRDSGVVAVMLADCCYSGGLARRKGKVRAIPSNRCFLHKVLVPSRLSPPPNAVYLACKANEVAYSTGSGGAMTLAFVAALEKLGVEGTLRGLHREVRKSLPSWEWPQTPQFVCRDRKLASRTLGSFLNRSSNHGRGKARQGNSGHSRGNKMAARRSKSSKARN